MFFLGPQTRRLDIRSSCKGRREQWACELVLLGSSLASLASFVKVWKRLCLDFCLPLHPSKGGLALPSWRLGEDCALAAIEIGEGLCIDEIVKGFRRVGDWIGTDRWEDMRGGGALDQGKAF